MNKKEKLAHLLTGKHLKDFIFFRPILMHFAARFNNTTYDQFASDYRVLVDSNIKAMEYFDTDMVSLISDPYRETAAFGAKVSFPFDKVPRCENTIVRNFQDVTDLKLPDVYRNERTLDRINGAREYNRRLRGNVPVSGWIEGPLAEACDLAGVSFMLTQLMVDPDFSNEILDKCLMVGKNFAKAQVLEGCDVIGIGDSICSQIDPATYDQYLKERHKELIDFIHAQKALVKLHICGDITHLLPSLADVGMDILDLDWQVDMDDAYSILGPGIIRGGNMNPVDLQNKTTEEITDFIKKQIQNETGRKFILAAGCEITVNTPIKNLKAMREAAI